ncbi:MAG: protein kinase, partial [Phycisphaerales bacterium]|nr:protein kinase [Phycisphaerales bacterium]
MTPDGGPPPSPTADTAATGAAGRASAASGGSPAPPPAAIARYRLLRTIGEGGQGVVYEAVQDQPRRPVALKTIRPGLMTPEQVDRFLHEAQTLAELSHPGIAHVYEAGVDGAGLGATPYFSMELIPGALPIVAYADSRGLGPRQRTALVRDAARAVQHAHERGVIHRDLKPSNILVDAEGRVKVIDFGIARSADAGRAVASGGSGGEVAGTAGYMAPEQKRGDAYAVGPRADVFALGVVLYEMLTGRLPSVGRERPPLARTDRRLNGDFDGVVDRALAADPEARYRSAGELASALGRLMKGQPVPPAGAGLWRRVSGWWASVLARRAAWVAAVWVVVASVASMLLTGAVSDAGIGAAVQRAVMGSGGAAGPLERVRLIAIKATLDARLEGLCRDAGIEGVSVGNLQSLRRVHARLLDRLAGAAPTAVVFDITFARPSPFDDELAASVGRLVRAGVPVVVAERRWGPDAEAPGVIDPLLPAGRPGGGAS